MGSIFMGFVFAALLQLLNQTAPLSNAQELTAKTLVAAMLLLLAALFAFHATASRVIRYWGIFDPSSRLRTLAAVMFSFGIVAMLASTALMLWARHLTGSAWVVGISAVAVLPYNIWLGQSRRAAHNVRHVR
jgi:uncharacterized membrane protein